MKITHIKNMTNNKSNHLNEINSGNRFEFGKNWIRYLDDFDDIKLNNAEESLKNMLNLETLKGKSFLDVGCGSAIFSLAAKNLGANVVSVDYDPNCITCANNLKNKFYKNDDRWTILEGSAINKDFMVSLGQFDIVYSWGVLHHTGEMWNALNYIDDNVKEQGKLFISLYNDQGFMSKVWKYIKKLYVITPRFLKFLIAFPCLIALWGPTMLRDLIALKPFISWRNYNRNRGMAAYRDLLDWVGGYPFEVASPDKVFLFYKQKNYSLKNLVTISGGHGCNQYVFQKDKK